VGDLFRTATRVPKTLTFRVSETARYSIFVIVAFAPGGDGKPGLAA